MKTIYGKKCLLDTNILLFARDKISQYHKEAAELFRDLESDKFTAFVSLQNLLEFSAVLTKAYHLPQREVAKDFELLLAHPKIKVLYPTPIVTSFFLKLLKRETKVYVFDLYLVATVEAFSLDTIISDDNDFKQVKGISVYNPFLQN